MLITIRQIEIFLTIVKEKSIAAASEKLHLSKPAISMALNELETRLGHQLFDRVKNRLIINYYGQQALSKADELYHRTLEIEQLFDTQSITDKQLLGKLTIGASNTIGNYLIPKYLSIFRQNTGHKTQNLIIDNTDNICQKVADYQLDIGVIEGYTENEDLLYDFWREDEMCIIAANSHPLTQKKSITINELENSNWILREEGSGSKLQFIQLIASQLKKWHTSIELPTTQSIINAVENNLGLAFVSKLSITHAIAAKQIKMLNISDQLEKFKRKLWIITHIEKYHNPLVAEFIKTIKIN